MVRILVAASLALAILSTHFAPRVAAHSGYWRVAQTAGEGLRLRTGPSGEYRIIEVMPRGDRLKAFGHRGNWIKVRHLATGSVGWASLTYVVADSAPASGGGGGLQLCWETSFNWTACAPSWIAQAIAGAARYYGVPYWAMMGIAACESAFDPNVVNSSSGVIGLYQFDPNTFYWQSPGANIWNVYDQAYTAAKMLARGLSSMFDCAWRIGYS